VDTIRVDNAEIAAQLEAFAVNTKPLEEVLALRKR
jgi:hypothetical protein